MSPLPPNNQDKLKIYADLIQIYPDNESYLRQYAKLLLTSGKQSTATDVLRQLHTLLIDKGKSDKADALAKQFPQIGRISQQHSEADIAIKELLPTSINNRLWLRLNQQKLGEGHYLYRSGDPADELYLLCDGELAEFGRDKDGRPMLLNLISVGDIVGESALFGSPRHGTDVAANRNSIVARIQPAKMETAMAGSPALRRAIEQKHLQRQILEQITLCPMLQKVPLDMRRHLARDSIQSHCRAGDILRRAGEAFVHVDLIASGSASFQMNDGLRTTILKQLPTGSLIGATAAIRQQGCPADLVALSGLEIVHIPYAAFRNVVEAYPPLRNALFAYAETQQMQIMDKLNEFQTQQLAPRDDL